VTKEKPPFRSKQEVIINAPLETVWEFNMDITKIPTFHPRVVKVELLSGKALREPGVSYDATSQAENNCVLTRTSKSFQCRSLSLYCRRTRSA
jgi:ligand-binding SRPBCC domain-containing protein